MTGSPIPSYPKVYAMGHPAIADLFDGPVVMQEKVDGSQFSFMFSTEGAIWTEGALLMRSKGATVYPETDDKLFRPAADTVVRLAKDLQPNVIYRGEVVSKPKHNTLAYSRVPVGNIILFDIERMDGSFFTAEELQVEANRLGLEAVPTFYDVPPTAEGIKELLQTESCLGGSLIEGVVVKNHNRWGKDGKFLAGKHVSEAFKETHQKAWKETNPAQGDVIQALIDEMRSPARWAKAVQHLRERGELEGSPRDIGRLIAEAKKDIAEEERERIAEVLVAWALPKVLRGATGGLPEWYKTQLLEQQFDGFNTDVEAEALFGYDPLVETSR